MITFVFYLLILVAVFLLPFLPIKNNLKTLLFSSCISFVVFILYITAFINDEQLSFGEILFRVSNGLIGLFYGVWLSRKYDITETSDGMQVILLSGFGVLLGYVLLVVSLLFKLSSLFSKKRIQKNSEIL
jgi:hypothetical protein